MLRHLAFFLVAFTLLVVLILVVLVLPNFVQDKIAPEVAHRTSYRYLPNPGNRIYCPDINKQGQRYVGYIATQADGSDQPVRYTCLYK